MAQKLSYGFGQLEYVNLGHSRQGANSGPVCYLSTPSQFQNLLNLYQLGTPKPASPHILRLGMRDFGLQFFSRSKHGKMIDLGSPLAKCPQIDNFLNFV